MPDLPCGTVTFLFTDIEGSTTLWERNPLAMRDTVERHLALLRTAIAAHDGVHFKTVGDMVQAAFPTAPQALAAAFASQRALLAEPWGDLGSLRVRMALHAGEATPDARGDYLSAPLNRLSRLLSAGHGGQILLSQAVQQLTRGGMPPGTELRDLGEHRLRDLLEPERVFQLQHPDLPEGFPPLKSLDARPNNLPRQPTPFLGREVQVREVVRLVQREDVQLLTLTGPGGTGKTRLALQAAADLLDAFADGVFVVSLAALTDPAHVPSAIALALGFRDEGEQPLPDRLGRYLATKATLLVLDNVEHLLDAAPLVGSLLAEAPRLKVLATSRVPLRLRAEHEYPVPPLGLPRRKPPPTLEQLSQYEAVRLFIERAQAVKPDFAIENETAPAVAEICWRLDGLPLAIELAAARVRMLSPSALLARLEKRLPLLTGGARDAPARQRTLRDTIAWSYDLLELDEQRLFRRLAVFAGSCTLDAAEIVGNHDGGLDTFPVLEGLVEHNLLRQEGDAIGEPRFAMLETIREFGLDQLEACGEAEDVRRRHAVFMCTLVEEADAGIHGPQQRLWMDRLDAEHDNVRVALGWSLVHDLETALRLVSALFWFWFYQGYLSEGRDWTEQALLSEASIAPTVRARVLAWSSDFAALRSDHTTALARAEEALDLARMTGDVSSEGWALHSLGSITGSTGDWKQASAFSAEAETCFRKSGERYGVAITLFDQGVNATIAGNRDQGQAWLEQSLAESRAIGDRMEASWALNELAQIALDQGQLGRARTMLDEALTMARAVGFRMVEAMTLLKLTKVANQQGDVEAAAAYLLQGETAFRDPRFEALLADFLISSGYLSLRSDDHERAHHLFNEALSVAREFSGPSGIARVLHSLGDVLRVKGDVGAAAHHYRDGLVLAQDVGDDVVIIWCLAGLAGLALDMAHYETAARLFGRVEVLQETVGQQWSSYEEARISRDKASAREALGDETASQARAAGRGLSGEAAVADALALAETLVASAASPLPPRTSPSAGHSPCPAELA